MIYSVFKSNLMLTWGRNLTINETSLVLCLCLWNEDARVLKYSLILTWRGLIVSPI